MSSSAATTALSRSRGSSSGSRAAPRGVRLPGRASSARMTVPRPWVRVGRAEEDPQRSLAAVVLAAGKGKRLKSSTPKVLHPICGMPALWHVLQLARAAKPDQIVVVVGHGADDVRAGGRVRGASPRRPVFVDPDGEQLGTGHAVLAAEDAVGSVDDVLVLGGDFDPVRPATSGRLVGLHRRSKAAPTIAIDRARRAGRLRPRRPRRRPAGRDRRGRRRLARDPAITRGLARR